MPLAALTGKASKMAGRGGTSIPGKVLEKLNPQALATLAGQLDDNVAVSATNGKTTTCNLITQILQAENQLTVANVEGANMRGGIAATLIDAYQQGGLSGKRGVFEIDEFWLGGLIDDLQPKAVLLCNLFRDQLDRYGELDTIADKWVQMVSNPGSKGSHFVLNADDPTVAWLAQSTDNASFYGIDAPNLVLSGVDHASDSTHCRRCGSSLTYSSRYVGHIGNYRCTNCGNSRPTPTVLATDVSLNGSDSSTFTINFNGDQPNKATINLQLPGMYNVYNAVAAAALCHHLGISTKAIKAGLEATSASFGRAESVALPEDRQLKLLLVKNPAGANEVIRTLQQSSKQLTLLSLLNDHVADGRDVSWIWDADYELLVPKVEKVFCGGRRAGEMANRWKYAGLDPAKITVVENDIANALDQAVESVATGGTLHSIPTYTAMLELRSILSSRGLVEGKFE